MTGQGLGHGVKVRERDRDRKRRRGERARSLRVQEKVDTSHTLPPSHTGAAPNISASVQVEQPPYLHGRPGPNTHLKGCAG